MSEWRGKTRGGPLGHQIFIFTLRYLGIKSAYFLLYFVAGYYFLFSWKSSRHIYFYFHTILKTSPCKSLTSLYRNYYVFGQVLIDKVAAMAGFSYKFTYDFEGEEHLRNMKDGGLLISAHIGNWEIAGNLLNRLDTRFNIVMFDEEHERIKEMLSEVMVNKNVNIIVLKDDLSHLIEIRNALANKELIAIHGDRFVEGSKTVRMDFLGRSALFPEGPFYLAAKFNVDVSYVFAMKETNSHYHFYATPVKRYGKSGQRKMTEAMIRPIMEDYLAALEKAILKYPLQWFNYYRFWDNED